MANRIIREVPGTEICGIIQQPVERLPLAQQLIINGGTHPAFPSSRVLSKAKVWFCSSAERLTHWAFWCIHGCPPRNASTKFTAETLAEECMRVGWPFLLAADAQDAKVLEFFRKGRVDLVIMLGELPLNPELLFIPRRGTARASQSEVAETKGFHIRVEHLSRGAQTPLVIASLMLPLQLYDGLLALTLKADLITDDLLVQTAKNLQTGDTTNLSKETKDWIDRILSPYLNQVEPASVKNVQRAPIRQRCRAVWKLCIETLLLGWPAIVVRNWYRSWRGLFPVVIVAHHLVTDRIHRMGVSTETFWRQVRFLQRHYRIVSLSESIELLHSGVAEMPCVALTFDDGYGDNFVNLRAVAEETGIPVALFVATQSVEKHQGFQHDLAKGIRGFFPLTWEQIRYWSRSGGGEFGSHTQTHFDCGSTDRKKLEEEIVGSKNLMEHRLEEPVRFFAFPFGDRCNVSSEAMQLAASSYPHVLTDFGGENLPGRGVNRKHLLRKNAYLDLWELILELQSVFDLIAAIRRPFPHGRADVSSCLAGFSGASILKKTRNASPNS
jgi:peptidoglycan/xylan/chitin deacetylase (PgdA/CDA1 family)